jgi:hypothetical protein
MKNASICNSISGKLSGVKNAECFSKKYIIWTREMSSFSGEKN